MYWDENKPKESQDKTAATLTTHVKFVSPELYDSIKAFLSKESQDR